MNKIIPGVSGDGHEVNVQFQVGGKSYEVFFRSADITLTPNMESFLAAVLLPCMRAGGGKIAIEGELSQRVLASLPTIQDIYCSWRPDFQRVEVENAKSVTRPPSTENRVAAFFSGGVDSWYTLLKRKDEITDLVYLHGTEIHLGNSWLRETTSRKFREAAAAYGKNLIEIETNLLEFLDSYIKFGDLGYGISLITVGQLLSPIMRRVYISAGFTYAQLVPSGAHPILDPLWSTESLEFIHDGCEAGRVQKVALISSSDIVLNSLHVCHKNQAGIYNCGNCEKCIRTMINLEACGALERCTVFSQPLTPRKIRNLNVVKESTRLFLKENLEALEKRGGDPRIRKALRQAVNRPQWLRKFRLRVRAYQRALARRLA